MTWLNSNAPAIQAIAAVVSVIVTVILAYVTTKYVMLTRELVRNGQENLQFIKEERKADLGERKGRLLALIWHLRMIATSLPDTPSKGEQIRSVAFWSESETQELRALASTFGTFAAELASEAARYLATLAELGKMVQETPPARGVEWNKFPWERWHAAFQGAERAMTSLVTHLERST